MPIKITFSDKTVHVAVYVNGQIESLITELPPRPWVGLTHGEIDEAAKSCKTTDTYKYFRAIEAKLKEKNT